MWKVTKDPWRCLNCSKLNRFNINCCGDYGGHWEDFPDHSIVPPSQQGQKQHKQATKYRNPSPRRPSPRRTYTSWLHEEPWNGQDWGEAYQEGNGSPRQRTTSPRQRTVPRKARKPKQPKPQKGEGKGKQSFKGKPEIAPPPWVASAASKAAPAPAAPTAAQSKVETKLQELVTAMNKKKDTLDPDLQNLAQEAAQLQNQSAT